MPAYVATSRGRLIAAAPGSSPHVRTADPDFVGSHQRRQGFPGADLTLPGEISVEALKARHSFLNLVDERYRQMEAATNFGMVDAFDERALNLITSPDVKKAFDLSLESTQTKEAYGDRPVSDRGSCWPAGWLRPAAGS